MTTIKIESVGLDLVFNLEDYPDEVANYVLDQFEDRLNGIEMKDVIESAEIELDYKNKEIIVTNILRELIQKAIEEKENDIEHERRHGERP